MKNTLKRDQHGMDYQSKINLLPKMDKNERFYCKTIERDKGEQVAYTDSECHQADN